MMIRASRTQSENSKTIWKAQALRRGIAPFLLLAPSAPALRFFTTLLELIETTKHQRTGHV